MNVQILGDNFTISDHTRRLVAEKLSLKLDRLLSKFSPEMHNCQLHITKDKLEKLHLSFDMQLPGKEHIYASTEHQVFESALIDLVTEVERQIHRYREKVAGYSLG